MNRTEWKKSKQKDIRCILDTLEAYNSMLSGEGGNVAVDYNVDPAWESKHHPLGQLWLKKWQLSISSKSEQRKWMHDAVVNAIWIPKRTLDEKGDRNEIQNHEYLNQTEVTDDVLIQQLQETSFMLMYLENWNSKESTFPNILNDKISLIYAFTCLYSPTAKFCLGKNSSMLY